MMPITKTIESCVVTPRGSKTTLPPPPATSWAAWAATSLRRSAAEERSPGDSIILWCVPRGEGGRCEEAPEARRRSSSPGGDATKAEQGAVIAPRSTSTHQQKTAGTRGGIHVLALPRRDGRVWCPSGGEGAAVAASLRVCSPRGFAQSRPCGDAWSEDGIARERRRSRRRISARAKSTVRVPSGLQKFPRCLQRMPVPGELDRWLGAMRCLLCRSS
mmetsp:Transcript_42109/g.95984  ORF Transcript_42109/g.95984 Transcript_42109/m.95984 type:complete len:217 (+) Transcript_42109:294-944(+)